MTLIKYLLIVLLISPITLIGQTKSQAEITSKWKDGTYKRYDVTRSGSYQSNGESKITFEKKVDGVSTLIGINYEKFKTWGKGGSSWVSGYSQASYACLFFTDDGRSIIRYELETKSNKVSTAYTVYGEKLNKEKPLIEMINAYLKFGIEQMDKDITATEKAKEEFNKIYDISDKEIKDLKIVLIADDKDLDVRSEFKVGYEVTKLDGTVIKSENLGGNAISYNYRVEVSGASPNRHSLYVVRRYCEEFKNKELKISVTARSTNPITREMKFPVSCVPDPAIIERKKRRLEAQKAGITDSNPSSSSSRTSSSRSNSSNSRVSKPKYVTVYNKTGKDIYYVQESSRSPSRINANSSVKLDCFKNYWYTFDANDGINGGNSNHPKLYSANSNCGNSTTID
jgi:hypothetical protein